MSRRNREDRVCFSEEYLDMDKKNWKDLISSDETKIYLFGSDGNTRVRRKVNIRCISARGVGNIHFIDGMMVKYVYNNILKKNVKESTIKMGSKKVQSRWDCHMFVCSNRKTIANTMMS